jgi:membrane fusion protein (multidrug efflux system)
MNTALMAIVPLNQVWVDANYKESQLSRLRIGQPVTLTADAYPDITYHGKIMGLSPGTGVTFSLLPPQNATGNWIKIVQRLPVRISLDITEIKNNPLLIGLSMHVTTETYHTEGNRLAKVANAKVLYATNVYDDQLALASSKIDKILQDNAPNMYLPSLGVTG